MAAKKAKKAKKKAAKRTVKKRRAAAQLRGQMHAEAPALQHAQNPNCRCQLVDGYEDCQGQWEECAQYPPPPPPPILAQQMVPVPYPATMTPQAPGEAPRRVPVPVDVTNLSERERRAITAALVAEESDLDRLADLHTHQGARDTADQLQRTASAVRGDVMRLRFRNSLWAAMGHLERLIDKTELAGVPELEEHLRRVDRALQGAVTSIVQEMRGVKKPGSELPQ